MPASPNGDRFLRAVEAVYDAAPEPSRWPHALGAIADYFESVGAILSCGLNPTTSKRSCKLFPLASCHRARARIGARSA